MTWPESWRHGFRVGELNGSVRQASIVLRWPDPLENPLPGSRRLGEKILGIVAGDLAAVDLALFRALDAAAIGDMRAAGREYAALGRAQRRGQFAAQDDALALSGIDARRRGEQRLRIGCLLYTSRCV